MNVLVELFEHAFAILRKHALLVFSFVISQMNFKFVIDAWTLLFICKIREYKVLVCGLALQRLALL